MRWSCHSWRAFAADPAAAAADWVEPPWRESAATQVVARLDLAYRCAHAATNAVPPLVLVTIEGIIDLWWCDMPPKPVVAPFEPTADHRWRLPAQVSVKDLAPLARSGQLHVGLVAQIGVTAQRHLMLADLDHWRVLGVEAPPQEAAIVLEHVVAGLGVPPLGSAAPGVIVSMDEAGTPTVPPGRGNAVLMAGRPPCGLWLVHRHGTWMLEPLQVAMTPVGLEVLHRPEHSGEPQQRSTS